MPNIDPDAKAWELALADRVGRAVYARRKALKLTAQQLAQRTADLGYPVTRVAISKIETNKRAGKVDVAELIVLAKALEMPPVLLLHPGFPEGYDARVDETSGPREPVVPPGDPYIVQFVGDVETLPGQFESSRDAVLWFSGRLPSMWRPGGKRLDEVERSPGAGLVQTDALLAEEAGELDGLRRELDRMLAGGAEPEAIKGIRRQIEYTEAGLAMTRLAIERGQAELWGIRQEQLDRAHRELQARGVKVDFDE